MQSKFSFSSLNLIPGGLQGSGAAGLQNDLPFG
jgi:hypothetical protein